MLKDYRQIDKRATIKNQNRSVCVWGGASTSLRSTSLRATIKNQNRSVCVCGGGGASTSLRSTNPRFGSSGT